MSDTRSLFKKDANFDIGPPSHDDLATRTYGFLKATRTDTPIPRPIDPLNHQTLEQRLHTLHDLHHMGSEDELLISAESASSEEPVRKASTAFEKKRKLFDEAEFTIARGVKMSESFCPSDSGLQLPIIPKDRSVLTSYEEVESYCRQMNFQLSK
ncbi:uncharacterized protein LOC108098915 [Drosophila ficusphila]|uniref:uncharacterized protein LOC108098915 n=1 Tax=Drosophila ficusphila TaxID=30025 RepID=UPI0007E79233|nr:uncharacterized protein LOC108098915 [Drosophila ficusphila]